MAFFCFSRVEFASHRMDPYVTSEKIQSVARHTRLRKLWLRLGDMAAGPLRCRGLGHCVSHPVERSSLDAGECSSARGVAKIAARHAGFDCLHVVRSPVRR